MVQCNSIETSNISPNLNNEQQLRLNKINKTKYYFVAEIKERELMKKRLSKYIASFDYFNCFFHNNWQHFCCIICNCYWSTGRNSKCKT